MSQRRKEHIKVFTAYQDVAKHFQAQHDYKTVRLPTPPLLKLLPMARLPLQIMGGLRHCCGSVAHCMYWSMRKECNN